MEEKKLSHNVNSRKPTSHIPSALSPKPNKAINSNTTQGCRSATNKDSAKQACGEMHNENDKVEGEARVEEAERERLKRHREEIAGQVLIQEKWGQEQLLKDWIDCTTFDASLAPHRMIVTARDALIADTRKARSQRLRLSVCFPHHPSGI